MSKLNKNDNLTIEIYDYDWNCEEDDGHNDYYLMEMRDNAISLVNRLSRFEEGDKILVVGSIKHWAGRLEGYRVIDNIEELCITSISWSKKDGLEIENSHHDGCDYYGMRILNNRGIEYLFQNEETPESLSMVSKPYYSRAMDGPRFGAKLARYYGIRKNRGKEKELKKYTLDVELLEHRQVSVRVESFEDGKSIIKKTRE